MCGRYYYDDTIAEEIQELVAELDRRNLRQRSGDIHPSEPAPVLCALPEQLSVRRMVSARRMRWGFSQRQKSGLLINARAETVLQRPMFCDAVLHRRCVILARHFYEWDAGKNKVTFSRESGRALYLAGFYSRFGEEERFVILTTQANGSVRAVHHRMPLILNENEWQDWIYSEQFLSDMLKKTPDKLKTYREYEQQSLF
nr:SOS response-associated peptidase [uncultured Marvinbryantia sp.]